VLIEANSFYFIVSGVMRLNSVGLVVLYFEWDKTCEFSGVGCINCEWVKVRKLSGVGCIEL
jgi:hypothetical protein